MINESGIYPTGDMVLVLPLEVERKTASGLVISSGQTDREQMAQSEGIAVCWGKDAPKSPRMDGVESGSLIGFAKWAGQEKMGKDEKKYRLIRGDDVICTQDEPSLDAPKARIPLNPAEEAEFDMG